MRVGRKRLFWWSVAGFGLAVLLFVVLLSVIATSADAKMEATLDKLTREYGFEVQFLNGDISGLPIDNVDGYWADGLTHQDADKILETIKDACQDCQVHTILSTDTFPGAQVFELDEQYESMTEIWVVRRVFDFREPPDVGIHIWVNRSRQPNLLERAVKWLPW